MRRPRRRRTSSGRTSRYYSLDELLSRQPKSIRTDPRYRQLSACFYTSELLPRLRISRRCYRLLDKAIVDPENLVHFYKTYRLPKDPFFPLFFCIKRDYLAERERKREEREAYILKRMKALPVHKIRFIRFLGEWEQEMNRKMDYPYWEKHLYPGTKKRVHEYEAFGPLEWDDFFRSYLAGLLTHYHYNPHPLADRAAACAFLELLPVAAPLTLPDKREVLSSYRRLCRIYHPDRGGSSEIFIRLKESKEILYWH